MGEHMCAIITLKGYWHVAALASYPAFTDGQKKTPGFSRLHMREIFPKIWETVLFWYSSTYGIRITVLF